jgi:hypothetical protein
LWHEWPMCGRSLAMHPQLSGRRTTLCRWHLPTTRLTVFLHARYSREQFDPQRAAG